MKKPILLFLLVFITLASLEARHIIGGDISYVVEEFDDETSTISLVFTLYRDIFSGGANFDATSEVGIYGYKNNDYQLVASLTAPVGNIEEYDSSESGCPGFNYETGEYAYSFVFQRSKFEHYSISYQRCCLQDDLSNILNPAETGIALELILFDQVLGIQGSGPVANRAFPSFAEVGGSHSYDMSSDISSIVRYELNSPSTAGGTDGVTGGDPNSCTGVVPNPQNCPPPFEMVEFMQPNSPYGVGNNLELDVETGILSSTLSTSGKAIIGMRMTRLDANDNLLSFSPQQFVSVFSNCIVGVEDEELEVVSIYPNPTSGNFSLNVDLLNLQIFANDGRRIKDYDKVSKDEDYIFEFASPGIYLAKGVRTNGEKVFLKLMKSE